LSWRVIKLVIRQAQAAPRHFKADSLAKMLRLKDAERTACGIRTIGAIDLLKAERTKRRKARHRARQKARRVAKGATPREQALTRTRPWEGLGISRRTWERRGKPKRGVPWPQPRSSAVSISARLALLPSHRSGAGTPRTAI
jgi:hypothetical protein